MTKEEHIQEILRIANQDGHAAMTIAQAVMADLSTEHGLRYMGGLYEITGDPRGRFMVQFFTWKPLGLSICAEASSESWQWYVLGVYNHNKIAEYIHTNNLVEDFLNHKVFYFGIMEKLNLPTDNDFQIKAA